MEVEDSPAAPSDAVVLTVDLAADLAPDSVPGEDPFTVAAVIQIVAGSIRASDTFPNKATIAVEAIPNHATTVVVAIKPAAAIAVITGIVRIQNFGLYFGK